MHEISEFIYLIYTEMHSSLGETLNKSMCLLYFTDWFHPSFPPNSMTKMHKNQIILLGGGGNKQNKTNKKKLLVKWKQKSWELCF